MNKKVVTGKNMKLLAVLGSLLEKVSVLSFIRHPLLKALYFSSKQIANSTTCLLVMYWPCIPKVKITRYKTRMFVFL